MTTINSLKIKIFADGADLKTITTLANEPIIKGFTTNPSLMRKDGVINYEDFARQLIKNIPNKPISFEIFADDFETMEIQARCIASWGKNVYVKIPVTNTKGEFTGELISKLSQEGIPLNVTAILTIEQVQQVTDCLSINTPAIISIFAGRIADTGIDPMPVIKESAKIISVKPKAELLWASSRELLNIIQADLIGCHIITVTYDMLKKLSLIGKDLNLYSLETVSMFYKDAVASGFIINNTIEEVSC